MDYRPDPAMAVDAISTNVTVVTEPAIVRGLTPQNISQFILFTSTATDEFGNAASCQYMMQVESTYHVVCFFGSFGTMQ